MARRPEPRPYQRPDGTWRLDVQVGRGSREHRKRRSLYGSSSDEVLDKLDELRRRERIGLGPIDERLTVAAYLASWVEGLTGLRPRTLESYTFTVNRHLIPALGHVSLIHLAAPDVRRAVRSIEQGAPVPGHPKRRTGGSRTAAYAVTVLRIALGLAVRDRILERNVASDVRRPTSTTVEPAVLNAEQARAFLVSIRGDRLYALWLTAVSTGARRGELTGLGWPQVDLEASTLRITRSLTYLPGDAYTFGLPKTSGSKRTIRLPALVADELRAHKQRQREERIRAGAAWRREEWKASQLVFTTGTGGPLAGSTLSHALHRHLAAAKLPRLRVHDLRHSTASILMEAGLDRAYIMELLGHTDMKTSGRYTHVRPTSTVTAEAMAAALTAAPEREEDAR
jgi:integrase